MPQSEQSGDVLRFSADVIRSKEGWVDEVDADDIIRGWAYEPGFAHADVSLKYNSNLYVTAKADRYRADLEASGLGAGYHSFHAPLPCDPSVFRPELFEACFTTDGTTLPRSEKFLKWENIDLLSSPVTDLVNLELTSRCNLRCVYCAVSQPSYQGQDMRIDDLSEIIETLKSRRIQSITVNGHGETTLVPGWQNTVIALAREGIRLNIITNFARLLSDEELEAMARIPNIVVSVDTHRPEVLRQIRRRVSLGNILVNMNSTTAKAMHLGLPPPTFTWSCVPSDRVAADIVDYARFGLACGVKHYQLCNLCKYPDVADAENVQHVTTLPDDQLSQFARDLVHAQRLIEDAGGTVDIAAGLPDSVRAELTARGLEVE